MCNRLFLLILLAMVSISKVTAAAAYQGVTSGVWDKATRTGFFIDWYKPPFLFNDNNAADAVVTGEGTDFMTWGNYPLPLPPPIAAFSSVRYVGAPYGPVAPDKNFPMGSIVYTNGTIALGTGTYGGDLTISATDIGGAIINPLVTSYFNIDTVNYKDNRPIPFPFNLLPGFNNFNNVGELLSADGIFFPGLKKYALVKEGGSATFNLMGRIVGDPMMEFVDIELNPGSAGLGGVFSLPDYQRAGSGLVPESGTLAMLAAPLLIGLLARRNRPR